MNKGYENSTKSHSYFENNIINAFKAEYLKTINFPEKSQESTYSLEDVIKKRCIKHSIELVCAENCQICPPAQHAKAAALTAEHLFPLSSLHLSRNVRNWCLGRKKQNVHQR